MPKSLDSNSDHKGRRQYEVIRRDPNAPYEINVGGRTIKLGKKTGAAILNDEGLAKEIHDRHSLRRGDGKFNVIPVEKQSESGHKRTFLVRLPKNYKRGE